MTNKQTIWEYKQLSSLGSFSKGVGISKADIVPQGAPCIRYAEIYTKYNFQLSQCLSHIPTEIAQKSTPIAYGNILFAGSGETAEDIGKSVAYLGKDTAYASGDIIIFTLKDKKENALFFSYYLNTAGRQQLNKLGEGQSVVHIYPEELSKVFVPHPLVEEQHRIVEVLETWDKAIQLTRKLIEQKELQKKYLMQQLLTGRTRLKGFSNKWGNYKLQELAKIHKGKQLNSTELTATGEYPCLNGGITPSGYTHNWNSEKNTISISEGGNSCGYVNWNPKRFWAGGHCYTLSELKADPEFLYFLLKYKEKYIMSLRVGSGLPNIQRNSLENLILYVPNNREEQSRIGRLLVGVDLGGELLQKRLAQLEEQKKGLMQVLLTGKIRLAVKENK